LDEKASMGPSRVFGQLRLFKDDPRLGYGPKSVSASRMALSGFQRFSERIVVPSMKFSTPLSVAFGEKPA